MALKSAGFTCAIYNKRRGVKKTHFNMLTVVGRVYTQPHARKRFGERRKSANGLTNIRLFFCLSAGQERLPSVLVGPTVNPLMWCGGVRGVGAFEKGPKANLASFLSSLASMESEYKSISELIMMTWGELYRKGGLEPKCTKKWGWGLGGVTCHYSD